jgi:nicotinate-nucleotide adenylyltransferase
VRRSGVFGGTFDPPHLGHLILAAEALDQLHLDRVLWVLTPIPPHKLERQITAADVRMRLVLAAIEGCAAFELSTVDIDRLGPHYAYETLRLLREQYPHDELVYLVGGDSLRDLPAWKEPRVLLDNVDELGVMRRPGAEFDLESLEDELPGICARLSFMDAPRLDIASSDIRARITAGRPTRFFLPAGVMKLIEELKLYQ